MGVLGIHNPGVNAGSNAADVSEMDCPDRAHRFRLVYSEWARRWETYCAFFSGRLGAVVLFPGPNNEKWRTADIITPLSSNRWIIKEYELLLPIRMHVEWDDLTKVLPSMPLANLRSNVTVT